MSKIDVNHLILSIRKTTNENHIMEICLVHFEIGALKSCHVEFNTIQVDTWDTFSLSCIAAHCSQIATNYPMVNILNKKSVV